MAKTPSKIVPGGLTFKVVDAANVETTSDQSFISDAQKAELDRLIAGIPAFLGDASGYILKLLASEYEAITLDAFGIMRVLGQVVPRLATQAETLAGLLSTASVTPKDLALLLLGRTDVTSRAGTASGYLIEFDDPTLGRFASVDVFGVLRVMEKVIPSIATAAELAAGTSMTAGTAVAQVLQLLSARIGVSSGAANGYLVEVVDPSGYRIFGIDMFGGIYPPSSAASVTSEVASARGTKPSLSAYLLTRSRSDGLPSAFDQPLYNGAALRETRRFLRQLKEGTANTQFVINTQGDSWTDNSGYWLYKLAQSLVAEWGDAGPGYVSFVAGSGGHAQPLANFALASVALTGSWAKYLYTPTVPSFTIPSPDLSSIISTTAGDKITVNVSGGLTSLAIMHRGGGGDVRYRYNGGSWMALSLTGSNALEVKALGTPPAGALTIEIEVVSGTCELYGADCRNAVNGVRWNKCAMFGTRTTQHLAPPAADWQRGMTQLAANLHTIMLGTNDRYDMAGAAFGTNIGLLIDRVRAATPKADILLISPPENLATGTSNTMADLAYNMRTQAALKGCAHLDLQPAFGASTSQYDDSGTGTGYFTTVDGNTRIHPSSPAGGAAVGEAIRRAIFHGA